MTNCKIRLILKRIRSKQDEEVFKPNNIVNLLPVFELNSTAKDLLNLLEKIACLELLK